MQLPAILTLLALVASLFCPSGAPVYAQGRDNGHFDEVIFEMSQAYKAHDRKKLTALLPQVQGYVLEPWAAYWELSTRLDEVGPTELQEYFTRYAGTYQEDRLRVDLLLQLGRNRDWPGFNRHLAQYRMNDDKSVRCYQLLADHETQHADTSAEIVATWMSLKEPDEACNASVQQLLEEKALAPAVVWQRARLGIENDRMRLATQAVSLLDENWSKTLHSIYQDPQRYLKGKFTALSPHSRELVILAILRLAYLEPEQAAQELRLVRWRAQLSPQDRNWIWGAIGKRAAQKLAGNALEYFSQCPLTELQDDHLAWATRAALRAGEWPLVQKFIDAMPATMRNEPVWTYWRARAVLVRNGGTATATATNTAINPDREAALAALRSIAGLRGFYEQLALEDSGQLIALPPRPAPLTQEEKDAARTNPGLIRALYAIQLGLRAEGVREWNYTTNLHERGGMSDRALLAAADLACRSEVWDRCINSSERSKTQIDTDQRYPMPFKDQVLAQCNKIGLDPASVYGLIRQESRFVIDAKSSVGASGLMQVMPATAKWTAKKIGLTDFHVRQLNDSETNIAIGTGYLKLLLDSFDGSLPLAAAAYNAGPARARSWRADASSSPIDAAIWAENIPFSETRDYVKKVVANSTLYAAIVSGQAQSIRARLGKVGPRDSTRPDTSTDLP